MVWVPPNDTDEKQEEMNGNNDVVVRTHYQTRDSVSNFSVDWLNFYHLTSLTRNKK